MLKKKIERQLEHKGIIIQVDIPKQKSGLMCIPKCFLNQSVHSTNDNLYNRYVTDFLIELGMKPCMHLVEISIFSINNVTIRPT